VINYTLRVENRTVFILAIALLYQALFWHFLAYLYIDKFPIASIFQFLYEIKSRETA